MARLAGWASMRRWVRSSGTPSSTRFECFRRCRQAIAEGVRRALEDERQAGGALREIVERLPVGAAGIGVVDALDDQPGRLRVLSVFQRCVGDAFVDRLDADGVVAARHESVFEARAGQRLFGKRPPLLAVGRREFDLAEQFGQTSLRILAAATRTPPCSPCNDHGILACCGLAGQALPLSLRSAQLYVCLAGGRHFAPTPQWRSRHGGRYEHLSRREPQAGRQLPETRRTAAAIWQPPRPGDRRHRHRQDRDAADPGRRLFQRRRAGVLRRHQGRPVRHRGDGRGQGFPGRRAPSRSARSLRVPGIPGDLLGSVRRAGPPDPRHRLRDGAAAAVAADEPVRGAGRRHQHRLQASPTRKACCCST